MSEKESLVGLNVGDWALCFSDSYFRPWESTRENLELFRFRGAGWEYARSDFFEIRLIEKVMPNTYYYRTHYTKKKEWTSDRSRKGYRGNVIFSSSHLNDCLAKSLRLISIGEDAETAIEIEQERVMEKFSENVRKEAIAKIHNLFPDIFKD